MPAADLRATRGVREALDARDYTRAAALMTMLRLHWFIHLRWIFLALAVVTLIVERILFSEYPRPLNKLMIVVAGLGSVNLIWMFLSRHMVQRFKDDDSQKLTVPVQLFANGQVVLDLFFLTCILHFTGGVVNPMSIFYLFHMAIVSLLLKPWQAVLNGVWALLFYCCMVFGEWRNTFLEHHDFLPQYPSLLHNEIEYVSAAVIVFTCGVAGTLFFTLQIVDVINKRDNALRAANDSLQQAQIAIRDLQIRRSRFMQTAAHQLKSPLAVIQTLTDLIRSEIVPQEAVPGTCDKIISRCREGINQVTELLTLARVQEADPKRHSRSESSVGEILEQIIKRLRPLAQEKGLSFVCNIPRIKLPHVLVDPRDLEDCLGNLVENAVKYTPSPGSVTVSIASQKTAAGNEEITVAVSDTGIGINPELLVSDNGAPGHAPIFDDFRRGNNALQAGIPGTGLGLSIVRAIVEQTGGKIRVNSKNGEGSTFMVSFPAYDGKAVAQKLLNTRSCEILSTDESKNPP